MADDPANPAPTQALVVHRHERPRAIVHSWMRDGTMRSAWPGDDVDVPVDAARIGVKLIPFPIGSVREIDLDAGVRTHPHGSYEDVLFYQIAGRRLQVCEAESWVVGPGDASFEPHGVEHCTHQLVAGPFVEFALPAPRRERGAGMRIGAADARMIPCAVWTDGDAIVAAEGADAHWAPAAAARYERRLFAFPGHDLIETRLPAGTRTAPRTAPHDTLFYVVAGEIMALLGGVETTVGEGAALRAPAGSGHAFAAITDATLIEAAARAL